MKPEPSTVLTFQPLKDYDSPQLPAADALQATVTRMRALFKGPDDKPFIGDDRLQLSTKKMLDDIVSPPACAPLLDELNATLVDWIDEPAPLSWLKTIVLPPGDEGGVIGTWANQEGHQILMPPQREALISNESYKLPELEGEGVLVIPQLERWFLRHRNGLAIVRALLGTLDGLQRHCVIGCNNWAWSFLNKAVGANMVLPDALTFQPFDAKRLHHWFSQLSAGSGREDLLFRLTRSGEDVMALDDNGELKHDFFTQLAARSRGIPWVAWRLWRRSLRSGTEDPDEIESAEKFAEDEPQSESTAKNGKQNLINEQTLWVAALDDFSLPSKSDETALLVLHALLIHGSLTTQELRQVLPLVGESNVLSALVSAGMIERQGGQNGENGQVCCFAAAYPAIRSGLQTAGFGSNEL